MQCIPAQCGGHLIKLVKLALPSASTDSRNKNESKQLKIPILLVLFLQIYRVYFNDGCLFWYFVKLCKYLLWYVLSELLIVSLLNILNIFYSLNSNKENIVKIIKHKVLLIHLIPLFVEYSWCRHWETLTIMKRAEVIGDHNLQKNPAIYINLWEKKKANNKLIQRNAMLIFREGCHQQCQSKVEDLISKFSLL